MSQVTKLDFFCDCMLGCTEGAKEFEANNEFLNTQLTDDMSAKLHVVRLKNIACVHNEMHFMEFVLSKVRMLRKLSVSVSFYAVCSNEEAVVDITEYPRTLPDAQVIFMGRESESLLNECNAIMDTSTENTVDEVEETWTTGSGLSNDAVSHRRRQHLDIDTVAQLEEFEVMIKLEEHLHQMSYLSWMTHRLWFFAKIMALSKQCGIDCPEFPEPPPAPHQAMLK